MGIFWKYMRVLKDFKKQLLLSISFHLLTAVFTVVSIPVVIPFFQILFNRRTEGLNGPAPSGFLKKILYHLQTGLAEYEPQVALLYICLCLLGIFFFKNFFRYLAMYSMTPVRNGVVSHMRSLIYRKIMNLPLGYFKKTPKGEILARMSVDVQEVEWSILKTIEATFKSPFIIIGSIAIMIAINSRLSFFVVGLLVIIVVVMGRISRSLKVKSLEAQNKLSSLLSWVSETISGIKLIHAFSKSEHAVDQFEKTNLELKTMSDRVLRKRDLSSPVSEFFGILIVILLLWIGSNLVFNNRLEPEIFFAFIFAFYHVIEPSKTFATAYYSIQKGLASLSRIDEFLEITENELPSSGSVIDSFQENIEFSAVSFTYQGEKRTILNSTSFVIQKGETIALVGPSGAGKSTIFDLLLGFYDSYKGFIYLDGKEIRSISKESIRKLFSYVGQDSFLFHESIRYNIVFGSETGDKERVIRAAEKANAHGFIKKLQHGYDTTVGERGQSLSGGERQRIALARAIYRDTPILLFDEPTSAVDADSELLIQESLKEELKDKTSIIIAHRMKTIQIADKVLFLKEGRIVEAGSHHELVTTNGEYNRFVQLQSL